MSRRVNQWTLEEREGDVLDLYFGRRQVLRERTAGEVAAYVTRHFEPTHTVTLVEPDGYERSLTRQYRRADERRRR